MFGRCCTSSRTLSFHHTVSETHVPHSTLTDGSGSRTAILVTRPTWFVHKEAWEARAQRHQPPRPSTCSKRPLKLRAFSNDQSAIQNEHNTKANMPSTEHVVLWDHEQSSITQPHISWSSQQTNQSCCSTTDDFLESRQSLCSPPRLRRSRSSTFVHSRIVGFALTLGKNKSPVTFALLSSSTIDSFCFMHILHLSSTALLVSILFWAFEESLSLTMCNTFSMVWILVWTLRGSRPPFLFSGDCRGAPASTPSRASRPAHICPTTLPLSCHLFLFAKDDQDSSSKRGSVEGERKREPLRPTTEQSTTTSET